MKRTALLCLAVLLGTAQVAAAQDSAIRVKNPDGSVSVFEIPAAPPPPPTRMEKMLRAQMEEAAEEKRAQEAVAAVPEPEAVPAAPAESEPEAEPESEAIAAKEVPPPAQGTVSAFPPLPGRKPVFAAHPAPSPSSPPPPAAPGTVIGQNAAVRIALDHAPPSTDYRVFRRMKGDRRVYDVVFKTEDGELHVIVDAVTGDVVGW